VGVGVFGCGALGDVGGERCWTELRSVVWRVVGVVGWRGQSILVVDYWGRYIRVGYRELVWLGFDWMCPSFVSGIRVSVGVREC